MATPDNANPNDHDGPPPSPSRSGSRSPLRGVVKAWLTHDPGEAPGEPPHWHLEHHIHSPRHAQHTALLHLAANLLELVGKATGHHIIAVVDPPPSLAITHRPLHHDHVAEPLPPPATAHQAPKAPQAPYFRLLRRPRLGPERLN